MKVIVTDEKQNLCNCRKEPPMCTTYVRNNLEGNVFCSMGPGPRHVTTPREKNPCNCNMCAIKKEGYFVGTQFCMDDSCAPTEPRERKNTETIIDLRSADIASCGTRLE